MDLGRIAVRAIVAYVYLLVMTRASGKRVIGQATPFDFVTALIVGDLIDDALWAEVSIAKFGAAAGSIFFCEAFVSLAALRWRRFHHLVNGTVRVVLRNGRADHDALRREQLSDADLDHLLRVDGIDKHSEVKIGAIEVDHELSVIRKPEEEPATRRDAKRVKEMLA